jgi:hypothetical protein
MQVDLFLQACIIQRLLLRMQLKSRKGAIAIDTPIDQFFPLAIEVFNYLHKHANMFFHDYVNAI